MSRVTYKIVEHDGLFAGLDEVHRHLYDSLGIAALVWMGACLAALLTARRLQRPRVRPSSKGKPRDRARRGRPAGRAFQGLRGAGGRQSLFTGRDARTGPCADDGLPEVFETT